MGVVIVPLSLGGEPGWWVLEGYPPTYLDLEPVHPAPTEPLSATLPLFVVCIAVLGCGISEGGSVCFHIPRSLLLFIDIRGDGGWTYRRWHILFLFVLVLLSAVPLSLGPALD